MKLVSGTAAGRRYLLLADGRGSRTVRVVNNGVECLIEPLPEDDGGSAFVEGHHAWNVI